MIDASMQVRLQYGPADFRRVPLAQRKISPDSNVGQSLTSLTSDAKRKQEYIELERNVQVSTAEAELTVGQRRAPHIARFISIQLSKRPLCRVWPCSRPTAKERCNRSPASWKKGERLHHQADQTILPPLNALLNDITIPPALVLTIRDTLPAQNPDLWLTAISQLDDKIQICQSRGKVAAAQEMESVIDGLRAKALIQLPPFLLSLIRPLRSASKGISTNLAVLQTSLLLKYQPFYAFLLRNSPKTAKQVERGYVIAARSYYETALRRYTRALAVIKARTADNDTINLQYAKVEEEGEAVLLYMADDKDFVSAHRAKLTEASPSGRPIPKSPPGPPRQRIGRVHLCRPLLCRPRVGRTRAGSA